MCARTRVLDGLAYDRVQLDPVPVVRLAHPVAEVVEQKLAAVLVTKRQLRGGRVPNVRTGGGKETY